MPPSRLRRLLEALRQISTEGPLLFLAVAILAGLGISSVARAYVDDPNAPPSASAARRAQPALMEGAKHEASEAPGAASPTAISNTTVSNTAPATPTPATTSKSGPRRDRGRHTYRPGFGNAPILR